ncbi:MAG: nucleotidyltransferase domain-containing protein [Sulfuritalea sp.]|nr:nucleotidyltransferase domain-containing protein [Sulfuritalea sp.]
MAKAIPQLNNLTKTLDPRILEDVLQLHRLLGDELVRVALFGSCAKRSLAEAHDIDLALFTRSCSVAHIQDAVDGHKWHFELDQNALALSYGGGGGITRYSSSKRYDFVVLDDNVPDPDFMALNNSHLIYLTGQHHCQYRGVA